MAQGYVRQSVSDIVPSAVVRSDPVNAEFNTLRDAFAFDAAGNTGHTHDGSSDQGSYVPLISDLDGLNKVSTDSGVNSLHFAVEVSASSVRQFSVADGVIKPTTTNDVDIGTASLLFKDLYLAGTANIATLSVTTASTLAGAVTISGTIAADIDMGGNTLTDLATPTNPNDAARYVDVTTIAGSASAAAASAAAAEAALDEFTDLYLGEKSSDPTLDNDGNALQTGALYFNTSSNALRVYDGAAWSDGVTAIGDLLTKSNNLSDVASVSTSRTNLGLGTIATQASSSVTITGGSMSGVTVTGGSVTGITDLTVADGGTGASTASGARTNLGIVNGTAAEQDAAQRYTQVSTTATATAFQQIALTASSSYTVDLPASPTTGDWVEFSVVSGDATVNNVTVDGNGDTVNGDTTLVIDLNNTAVVVEYSGTEWRVY